MNPPILGAVLLFRIHSSPHSRTQRRCPVPVRAYRTPKSPRVTQIRRRTSTRNRDVTIGTPGITPIVLILVPVFIDGLAFRQFVQCSCEGTQIPHLHRLRPNFQRPSFIGFRSCISVYSRLPRGSERQAKSSIFIIQEKVSPSSPYLSPTLQYQAAVRSFTTSSFVNENTDSYHTSSIVPRRGDASVAEHDESTCLNTVLKAAHTRAARAKERGGNSVTTITMLCAVGLWD